MDFSTPDGRRQLGARIQRAIAEAGYDSLPAFGTSLGWSRALVYQYVNGTVLAQLDRLQQVAAATGKPLRWFLADDPEAEAAEEAARRQEVRAARDRLADCETDLARSREAVDEAHQSLARERLETQRARCLALRRGYDAATLLGAAQEWAGLAGAAGDGRQRAGALVQAGHAWLDLGRPADARGALEQAVELAEEAGEARLAASARQELVNSLQALGDVAGALDLARGLAASTQWWPRWSALLTWGALLEQEARYDEAEAKLAKAEAVAEGPDARAEYQPLARAYIAGNRANVALGRGLYGEARTAAEAAHDLADLAGSHDQEREALLSGGLALLRAGALDAADADLEQAQRWAAWTDDTRRQVLALALRAELGARTGRPTMAKDWAREALHIATETQQKLLSAWAAWTLGLCFWSARQPEDARQWLARAGQWAREAGARRLSLEVRLAAARASTRGNSHNGPAAAAEALPAIAEEALGLGIADLAAEASAWGAYALLVTGGDAERAREVARAAGEKAQAAGAWWPSVAARGVEALALAATDRLAASRIVAAVSAEASARARSLGLKARAVWTWPDLAPLHAARQLCSRHRRTES